MDKSWHELAFGFVAVFALLDTQICCISISYESH